MIQLVRNNLTWRKAALHLIVLAAFLAIPLVTQAQSVDMGTEYIDAIGLPSGDIKAVITNAIRGALSFIGFIMVVQLVYAGFLLQTHGGNKEAESNAQSTFTNAAIGLIVILSSVSMTRFVVDAATNAAYNHF